MSCPWSRASLAVVHGQTKVEKFFGFDLADENLTCDICTTKAIPKGRRALVLQAATHNLSLQR